MVAAAREPKVCTVSAAPQRWAGDFTLSRLRAKLADTHGLPPTVEPDYDMLWRCAEEGGALPQRRDAPATSRQNTMTPSSSSRQLSRPASSASLADGRPARPHSAMQLRAKQRVATAVAASTAWDAARHKQAVAKRGIRRNASAPCFQRSSSATKSLRDNLLGDAAKDHDAARSRTVPYGQQVPSKQGLAPALRQQAADLTHAACSVVPAPTAGTGTPSAASRSVVTPNVHAGLHQSAPLVKFAPVLQKPASVGDLGVPASQPISPISMTSPTSMGSLAGPTQEQEEKLRNASLKLWRSASGVELHVKQFLKGEPDASIKRLAKAPVRGVKSLLRQGADIDWHNQEWDGATLLIKAAREGKKELALYLLAMGADPLEEDDSGRGLLHWAAYAGCSGLVEHLVQHGVFGPRMLDVQDGLGNSPLHLAASQGQIITVRLLCRAGADTTLQNGGGFTPQELAETYRKWEAVKYLQSDDAVRQDLFDERKPLSDLQRKCDVDRASAIKSAAQQDKKQKKTKDAGKKDGKGAVSVGKKK